MEMGAWATLKENQVIKGAEILSKIKKQTNKTK